MTRLTAVIPGANVLYYQKPGRRSHLASDAQRRAKKRYDETRTKQYIFRLRLDADADIIARLESVPCKTAYLRKLVRGDLCDK